MEISIDATDSFISPPEESECSEGKTKKKHVFLYNIMVKSDTKSLPMNQMMSQNHTGDWIAYWLKCWIRMVGQRPAEIVCDQSKALINAILNAFTSCSNVGMYINRCLTYLSSHEKSTQQLPESFIRFDRSHIVQYFKRKIKDDDLRKARLFHAPCSVWLFTSLGKL